MPIFLLFSTGSAGHPYKSVSIITITTILTTATAITSTATTNNVATVPHPM